MQHAHVWLRFNLFHAKLFLNSVDLDQLASKKPADQDPHCFHSVVCAINWNPASHLVKICGAV